jgi:hypothetical protein
MSGQMPANHPPIERSRAADASPVAVSHASDEFSFDVPDGWSAGRPSSIRKASFAVEGGVDISVTAWENKAQMGDLATNIQRWAAEVGATSPAAGTLIDLAEETTVGGLDGYYVQLDGPDKTTLAAMIPRGDMVWFFKLWGPAAAVHPQQDAFRRFLDSVEFGGE